MAIWGGFPSSKLVLLYRCNTIIPRRHRWVFDSMIRSGRCWTDAPELWGLILTSPMEDLRVGQWLHRFARLGMVSCSSRVTY